MNKILLLLLLSIVSLYSSDNIWSKDTRILDKEKSERIIEAFESGDTSSLNFENDLKKASKIYDFKENILLFGVSIGRASLSEEVSNTTGSKSFSFSSYNTKLIVGKDFTMWHEEYTQPTRLYFTYSYTKADSGIDFSTWTLGIRENMNYWPIYETSSYKIFPTASFELGQSSMTRESYSISGIAMNFNLGVTYTRDDSFEYYIDFFNNSISWQHPIEGIADEMTGYGVNVGLNYKINYGDF